jgi:phosphoglycolate phosphatase-like HAD superfamily hydrolase
MLRPVPTTPVVPHGFDASTAIGGDPADDLGVLPRRHWGTPAVPPLRASTRPRPGSDPRVASRDVPRTVIVGLEGFLVDTHEALTLSWLVGLHDSGLHVPIELLRQLVGMSADELLRIVARAHGDTPKGRTILRLQQRIFRTWYLPRILPFIGVRRLLQRMKAEGLRIIALARGSASLAPDLVHASGVASLLDDVAIADGKLPDAALAEAVEATMAQTGCTRRHIALLGDSPYDVGAGERCGIKVVIVRCGGTWTEEALDGASAIYEDHVDLLAHFSGSPLSGGGAARRTRVAGERSRVGAVTRLPADAGRRSSIDGAPGPLAGN